MSDGFFGVGKWFIIVCLLLLLITPIYGDLDNYRWKITKEGNTYIYEDTNSLDSYKNIGNKMLSGISDTTNALSSIGKLGGQIIDGIKKILNLGDNSTDSDNDGTPDNLEDSVFDPCYVNPSLCNTGA